MQDIIKLVFAASALTLLTPAAMAEEATPQHQNGAKPVTFAKWSGRMTRLLSQRLSYPVNLVGKQEGIVSVKFLCSESGAPADVVLLKSSGSPRLDEAAMKAVGSIQTLHPLPDGITHRQKYVATILFAEDRSSYNRQILALRRQAVSGNKWLDQGRTHVAMGVGLLPDNAG